MDRRPRGLALRSLLWAVLLPGVYAYAVPWRWFGVRDARLNPRDPAQWLAVAAIALGTAILVTCIVAFARQGRGTLSPFDPPTRLVVRGLYRYVRNPMYVGVTLAVLGQALLVRSPALAVYWAVWFAITNAFILLHEEPSHRRKFGAEWEAYAAAVPRWMPRPPRG